MATAVQIELRVDEQGAVQGLRVFDSTVQKSTASVRQLNTEMGATGVKAAAAGKQAVASAEKIGVASLSSVEKTRLLTEEFGIHLPRAMVRLAAESKMVQASINAISGGLLALGAIQIGVMVFSQLIEGGKKVFDFMTGLSKGTQEYLDQVEKTRDQEFGDSHSIETTTARIEEATQAVKNFHEQAAAARSNSIAGWRGIVDPTGIWQVAHSKSEGNRLDDEAAKKQTQLDKLNQVADVSQYHDQRQRDIEWEHAADTKLRGQQKINAALQKQNELHAEERRHNNERDRILGNSVPANAGQKEETDKNEIAKREAAAETYNLQREQAQELAHLREQALEAGLRGIALLHAQEAAAIADLKFKDMDSVAARSAVHAKFHAEELRRLEDESRETQQYQGQAALAGFHGISKIQGEGDLEVGKIRGSDVSDDQKDLRVQAARNRTNAEILEAEQGFTDRVNQLSDESALHQVSGFARIHAEGKKQIDALQIEFQKLYGKDAKAPEYQAHVGELNRGVGIINSGSDERIAEIARHNAEATAQIEAEAHAHALSAEKQQSKAIQAEYEERLRKYTEELKQQEISQEDYNRRVLAAGELRDAQMVEAAKAAREKMAGEFTRFFKDPLGSMKEMGEKAAGEAAAAMVQRVQGRLSKNAPADHTATPGSFLDNIFGHIAGLPKNSTTNPDRKIETAGKPGAPSGLLAMSTAQIRIGNATISAASLSGGAASSTGLLSNGASSLGPGGSTSLMTVPGSAFGAEGGSTSEGAPSGFGGGTSDGGNGISGALGDVQQGVGLFKQAKGIFSGSSGSTSDASSEAGGGLLGGDSGLPDLGSIFGSKKPNVTGPSNGGMLGGGGFAANAMGAAGGAMGLFSAYQGNGGIGGALSGAMSGMQLGMSVGGPIGAGIGLIGGAILGAIGFGGREKARVYDLKQVRPRIANDMDSYHTGSMDYLSAYSDMQALDFEARKTLDAMGGSGRGYYWDTINKEIKQAEGKLSAEHKAGRSQFTQTAAQYDQGGWTGGFGSMATGPDSGWIHAKSREFVVHEQPAAEHAGALEAIRAGASNRDMARYYGASPESIASGYRATMMGTGTRPQGGGGDRTMNMNVHAIDAKGVAQFLDKYKHHIRAAVNSSYAENSGGSDA